MTIKSALVAGKHPETCVALACAPADAHPEHGQRERDEVAEHRNEREPCEHERCDPDEERGACAGPTACQGAANGRSSADGAEHAAHRAWDGTRQLGEEPAHGRCGHQGDGKRYPRVAKDGDGKDAERSADTGADTDPVPGSHPIECTGRV